MELGELEGVGTCCDLGAGEVFLWHLFFGSMLLCLLVFLVVTDVFWCLLRRLGASLCFLVAPLFFSWEFML